MPHMCESSGTDIILDETRQSNFKTSNKHYFDDDVDELEPLYYQYKYGNSLDETRVSLTMTIISEY